jgi:hypothetical protein
MQTPPKLVFTLFFILADYYIITFLKKKINFFKKMLDFFLNFGILREQSARATEKNITKPEKTGS